MGSPVTSPRGIHDWRTTAGAMEGPDGGSEVGVQSWVSLEGSPREVPTLGVTRLCPPGGFKSVCPRRGTSGEIQEGYQRVIPRGGFREWSPRVNHRGDHRGVHRGVESLGHTERSPMVVS
jgi:hypothetical protein